MRALPEGRSAVRATLAQGLDSSVGFESHEPVADEFFVVAVQSCFSISGQRIAADGSLVGGVISIFTDTTQCQNKPAIAYDRRFVLAWGRTSLRPTG